MLEYFNILNKLNNILKNFEKQRETIINDYPQTISSKQQAELNSRLENIEYKFSPDIKNTFNKLGSIIKTKRTEQEHFSTITLRKNGEFVKYILLGQNKITSKSLDMKSRLIPKIYSFPFTEGFYTNDYELGEYFATLLLIRLLSTSPLNKLQLILIDTKSIGKHFKSIRKILHNDFIYNQRILTYGKEIAQSLKDLADYMESILQNQLVGYKDWASFNADNPKMPLPLKVLIIFGFDNEFNTESMLYLSRITRFGIEAGILPIIILDKDIESSNDRNKKAVLENIANFKNIDNFLDETIPNLESLELKPHLEKLPSENELEQFLDSINEFYNLDSQIKYNIGDLLEDNAFFSKNSADGICVPIAKDMNERIVEFKIGFVDSEHHTLIGGRSGSGKSNFLHALISSLAFHYPPDELELFLLDYKEGVEFNAYTNPILKHASLVAIHSDVQYGKSFLEYIIESKNERAELFKKHNVKEFKDYRKIGKLARLVIIIDEFQVLLMNGKISMQIISLFVEILRKGRSYGIHLVLSTQSLRGIQADIGSMKGQIGNRIALLMDVQDSMNILSNDNSAAANLSGKPYGILNFNGGVKESNILVKLPFASETSLKQILHKIAKETKRSKISETRIYDGEEIIYLPKSFSNLVKECLRLGVVNNYRQDNLDISFLNGGHLAICAREKRDILESIKLSLDRDRLIFIQKEEDFDSILSHLEDGDLGNKQDLIESQNETLTRFIVFENYDKFTKYFIPSTPLSLKDETKRFKEFIENNSNIIMIFCVERAKQTFSGNKIVDYIDHFVVLNAGMPSVKQVLASEADQISHLELAHKNFYYNKLNGEIVEFKSYKAKNA